VGVSLVIGMENAAASSAIHSAVFVKHCIMFDVQYAADQFAAAPLGVHSSACTATGLAFDDVHALADRETYSPIVFGVLSIPTCEDTCEEGLAKKLPSDWYVVAPSLVWRTISRTVALREDWLGDGMDTRWRGIVWCGGRVGGFVVRFRGCHEEDVVFFGVVVGLDWGGGVGSSGSTSSVPSGSGSGVVEASPYTSPPGPTMEGCGSGLPGSSGVGVGVGVGVGSEAGVGSVEVMFFSFGYAAWTVTM